MHRRFRNVTYNPRSELTSAAMGTNQYGFAFDNIGNRETYTNNSEVLTYLANSLNQYANIANGITNSPTYDLDGNMLTHDGWTYSWNGENRLIKTESLPAVPDEFQVCVENEYDYLGRRFRKTVKDDYSGGTYSTTNVTTYIWNGWDLLAEMSDAGFTNYYVGGLSGLLSKTSVTGSETNTYFYCQDGLGNIVQLLDDAGSVGAEYEYDPYGNQLRATGSQAISNIFRYSSHIFDQETGLYYARNRYYSPTFGLFLSRDRIQEVGGLNVYAYCHNDPVNRADWFGLADYMIGTSDPSISADPGAGVWNSESSTIGMITLKALVVANIGTVWIALPDAANHILHYLGNSGSEYTVRLQNMIDNVPSAEALFDNEVALAQAFVESLDNGTHQITSGSAQNGYNTEPESWNWYYAVGGYSAWGKGSAEVCGDCYTLEMEYKFFDRYNWDAGKSVTILGVTVTDSFMGTFHRQGLAQEFDMKGSVKKTVKWCQGEAATVTDGWESEGGR